MIVALLGKAGAGKTTIAKKMEKYIKDSFVIDGDELRAETSNLDIGVSGREANMHLGFSRAGRLSDLGFTVFIAMQAPIKEIREEYLNEHDVQIIVENLGDNPKDKLGYNKNFDPDYSGINFVQTLQSFNEKEFYDLVFPKVLVPARFQTMHSGHKVIFEEAKRLSPNVTVGLRVDTGDIIPLEENIRILSKYQSIYNFKIVKSPNIDEDWTDFANKFDIYVQGNPAVIEKFNHTKCVHFYVPRYGNVSATDIRKSINEGKEVDNKVDKDVAELTRKILDEKKLQFKE